MITSDLKSEFNIDNKNVNNFDDTFKKVFDLEKDETPEQRLRYNTEIGFEKLFGEGTYPSISKSSNKFGLGSNTL